MNELLAYVLSYLAVFIMAFIVAQLWSKGLLFKYIRAKAGKKKGKVLLLIRTPIFDYEKIGTLIEGNLEYKDRKKEKRLLIVPEDAPFNWLGIVVVQIDETKNAVMKRDYSSISGFDANKMDDLMLRALNRSRLNDFKQKILIIIILVCVIALISIINIMILVNFKKAVMPLLANCDYRLLLQNTTTQTIGQVVTGTPLGG